MSSFKAYKITMRTELISCWSIDAPTIHEVVFKALRKYAKDNNIVIGDSHSSIAIMKDIELQENEDE